MVEDMTLELYTTCGHMSSLGKCSKDASPGGENISSADGINLLDLLSSFLTLLAERETSTTTVAFLSTLIIKLRNFDSNANDSPFVFLMNIFKIELSSQVAKMHLVVLVAAEILNSILRNSEPLVDVTYCEKIIYEAINYFVKDDSFNNDLKYLYELYVDNKRADPNAEDAKSFKRYLEDGNVYHKYTS